MATIKSDTFTYGIREGQFDPKTTLGKDSHVQLMGRERESERRNAEANQITRSSGGVAE